MSWSPPQINSVPQCQQFILNNLREIVSLRVLNKFDYTFGISIAVITVLLAAYGIYKGFFANKNLTDPWDDHDD